MSSRIEEGLGRLVDALLPAFPDEDPLDVDDRREQAFQIAQDVLELLDLTLFLQEPLLMY